MTCHQHCFIHIIIVIISFRSVVVDKNFHPKQKNERESTIRSFIPFIPSIHPTILYYFHPNWSCYNQKICIKIIIIIKWKKWKRKILFIIKCGGIIKSVFYCLFVWINITTEQTTSIMIFQTIIMGNGSIIFFFFLSVCLLVTI